MLDILINTINHLSYINTPLFYAELISKIILSAALVIGGFIFLRRFLKIINKTEESFQKFFALGISLFGYFYALTRIFYIFSDFLIEGTPEHLLFWRLAALTMLIALTFLEIIIETYLVKTYYFFTLIAIIAAFLLLILPLNQARIISYTLSPTLLVNIVGIYIYVAYKSRGEGETSKKAITSMFGISLIAIGIVIDGVVIKNIVGFDTGLIGAIVMMAGLALFFKANY